MKEKWTPHIIAVTALAVFIVLGLACASAPVGPPPTYRINTKPVASGFLQEKKAVIFNIVMADRGPVMLTADKNPLANAIRIGRVATFNKRAKAFDKANEAAIQEFLNDVDGAIAAAWQTAYNAETVQAAYNFAKAKPKLNFFNKPNAATKKEIASICAQNNAEFAVTIIQQVKHGYLDERTFLGTGKMIATTQIAAEICVYDKKGAVVIQTSAQLPHVLADLDYGYNFSPNDGDQYTQLFVEGAVNIITAILALDPSSTVSPEDFKEALKFHLATTEDDDEE